MLETTTWLEPLRSDLLTPVFLLVTQFGGIYALLSLLAIFYWLWRKDVAMHLIVAASVTATVNGLLKATIQAPRPDEVEALVNSAGWGMPSGHAQMAVLFWGWLAIHIGTARAFAGAALMILLIGFSRIYLGVHTPLQVLAGFAMGAVLLAIFCSVFRWLVPLLKDVNDHLKASLLAVLLISFALMVPAVTAPGAILPAQEVALRIALIVVGFWWGGVIEQSRIRYQFIGNSVRMLLVVGIGLAIFVPYFFGAWRLSVSTTITMPWVSWGLALLLGMMATLFVPLVLARVRVGGRMRE